MTADEDHQDVPESSVPESSVPESSVPESSVPESSVPESSVPESSVPESSVPESSVPESSVPESGTTSSDINNQQLRDAPSTAASNDQRTGAFDEQAFDEQAFDDKTELDGDRTQIEKNTQDSLQGSMPVKLAPPTRADSIGRLDNYEILSVVGRGGMGIVARAFDDQLHRYVAIKVMSDRLITSERARKRFLREARAAASISHPNVVTIHSVAESDGAPYLVMEYVDGQALQARIRKDAPMPYEDVLRIGSQIASGLAAAHRHGVIHRDIKPGNVMLEDGIERVKLTDFGLARLLVENSDLTSFGDMVGTPAYMSPEQVNGDEPTRQSDLFSLGCVLYATFPGKSPFYSASSFANANRVKDHHPAPISSFVKDIPADFDKLVSRLLCKSADGRPDNAEEIADTLLQWSAEIHQKRLPGSQRVAPVSAIGSARSKSRLPWLVAAGATVAMIAGLAIFQREPQEGDSQELAATRTLIEDAMADGKLRVHSSTGEFATLRAAIAAAQPNTTIELQTGTYRGPFELANRERLKGLRIVGQEGVTLVGPVGAPVLRIANIEDFQLRDLTVQSGTTQIGVNLSGDCPGLRIQRVRFVAQTPEHTKVGLIRMDRGASGTADAPIEVSECEFEAGAVALVIGSHDTSELPVRQVHVSKNRLRAASLSYGIPIVVQGLSADIDTERNVLLRGLGGLSINLPVTDGAERVVFRYNTLAQIDVPFLLNDSVVTQDVRIEHNLVMDGRTLHTVTGTPMRYEAWFSNNQWVDGPSVALDVVELMFTMVPSTVLRSRDPDSPDFLKPSEEAPKDLAGFYYSAN